MTIYTRKEAIARKYLYYKGRPCKKCGGTTRYTSSSNCVPCQKESMSNRAKDNPESHKNYQKRYRQTHDQSLKEKQKSYYNENREYILNRNREYYHSNKEQILSQKKEYYLDNKDAILKSQNSAESKERKRQWRKNNLDKDAAKSAKRRASTNVPQWADLDKIRDVYAWAKLATAVTGVEHHVDHIVPLQGKSVSGLHVENNLQVLPWWENLEKSNKISL